MKSALLLLVLLNILLGCNIRKDTVLPSQSSVMLDFKIGQERTLTVEGTTSKTLKIKFSDVKEGRCTGSQCETCYGGYAYAYFEVWNGNSHDSFTLSRVSCVTVKDASFENPLVDRTSIQGLRIGLAMISDNQSNISQYKAQLLISDK